MEGGDVGRGEGRGRLLGGGAAVVVRMKRRRAVMCIEGGALEELERNR